MQDMPLSLNSSKKRGFFGALLKGGDFSLVVAGMAFGMVAARDTGHDPARDELLGDQVYRPADPEDHLDAVLLEEFDRPGSHASRNHVGHIMGGKERRQDAGLVAGALQHLPVEYDAVLNRIEGIRAAVAEVLGDFRPFACNRDLHPVTAMIPAGCP